MEHTSIKTISTLDEARQLISAFSLAFEAQYDVDDAYLSNLLKNESAVLLGMFVKEEVVGGLVAFELTPIHGSKEMYIYDIAVRPDYRKQKIGTKLIEHLKEISKRRGVSVIFVEAESEDAGAVAFYRAAGGEEISVNHFNFSL